MTDSIRVLVICADSLLSSAFALLLGSESEFEVSECRPGGARHVTRACREVRPHVVIFDVGEAAAALEEIHGGSRGKDLRGVIAVVASDSPDVMAQMFASGVRGVVAKDAEPGELITAVRDVSAGHVFASRTAMRLLLTRLTPASAAVGSRPLGDHEQLSSRERDAVDWLAQGMTNQEIARAMFVSEATVKAHLSRVMSKWGARDRVQLVIRALGAGFAAPDHRRASG